MAAYKGLDGNSYDSFNAKEAADGRFLQKQTQDQIWATQQQARQQKDLAKKQELTAANQLQQQREFASQQLAEQQRIAEQQVAEQRQIAAQQVAEQQRIAEQQECDRQQHVEKMRILGLFDEAGINYAVYENFSKYLFVLESPRHYPPEMRELNNQHEALGERYSDASEVSFVLGDFNAAMRAVNDIPLWREGRASHLQNRSGDATINAASNFVTKESNSRWKPLMIALAVFEVLMIALGAIFTTAIPTFALSLAIVLVPVIAILAVVGIKMLRRRKKKTVLLAHLHIQANALHQKINALAGVNGPDIGYAINTLREQRDWIQNKAVGLEYELVKSRWEHFHEFRLNNYNPKVEKLLLDMNLPAQLKEYNVGFASVSKNTAIRSNDDIQDYIVYFQEVAK